MASDNLLKTGVSKEEFEQYLWHARSKPWEYLPKRFDIPYWHEGMTRMCRGAIQAIAENKPLVIGSAHAQSKDYLAGRLALWFFEVWAPCIVLLTAPTDRQVRNVMWGELTNAYNTRIGQDDNLGKYYKTKFQGIGPDGRETSDHYILPFTTKETGEGIGKFQGFHSKHVMVVFSEAQAIPDNIYDQVDGVLTGAINLFVCLGNPTRATGRYASMLKDKKNNVVVTLDATKSPNYLAKKIIIPGMSTYEWVEDKRRKWGEDDPRWYGKVLGVVPPTGVSNVFPDKYWELATKRKLHFPEEKAVVACDPAGGGEDDCEIIGMKNNRIVAHKTLSGNMIADHPEKVAHEMVLMRHDIGANAYGWDANGLGHFLGALLKQVDKDDTVEYHPFKGSESAKNDSQYQNARAELHFDGRRKLIEGEVQLEESDDGGWHDKLREEAISIEYLTNTRTGKIQIEDKDDIRERIGRSPNALEAWLIGLRTLERAKTTRESKRAKTRDRWADDDSKPRSFMAA